ncbi:MAG: hypothetical protein Q9200_005746 [Gallowayella weberi]
MSLRKDPEPLKDLSSPREKQLQTNTDHKMQAQSPKAMVDEKGDMMESNMAHHENFARSVEDPAPVQDSKDTFSGITAVQQPIQSTEKSNILPDVTSASQDSGGTEGQQPRSGIPEAASNTSIDSPSRVTSTSILASFTFGSVDGHHDTTLAPHSPRSQPGATSGIPNQAVNSTASNAKPPRPTSVPVGANHPTSARKCREYPRFPDQDFAALPSQQYLPSQQPHPLRTRSSHPSQNSSSSSIPSRGSRDQISMMTGAKTVGNTPAQSPGLFENKYPASRSQVEESEDSQTSTPLLHPAHMQTPKETHKLSKDIDPISGRKIVNNYEFVRSLGSGQHGTVKLARDLSTGGLVAVKIVRRHPRKKRLRRTEDTGEMIRREIAILKKARHPHVVSLLEVIDDEDYQKVYLILEFVHLGEIAWRKKTDKDVAIFEMNRITRELTGHFDDDTERGEVDNFNSTAVTRRSQKALALEKRKAMDEEGAEANDIDRPSSAASEGHFWSLECRGNPEENYTFPSSSRGDVGLNIVSGSTPQETSQTSSIHGSPSHGSQETPKLTAVVEAQISSPYSQPDPSPWSSAHTAGNMYGPYMADEESTETILQTFLHQLVTADNDWSEDEEGFMHVPCLTISQALDVFRDTVLGLEYLHYQGIIHRDIKPANLLWTQDYRVKISDFGVSYLGKPIREDANQEEASEPDAADLDEAIELAKTVGTPAFYAPELCDPDIFAVEGEAKRPPVTGQIDVWALGVTLYGMIFGRLPFYDKNEFVMYEKIAKETLFVPRQRLKGVEAKPSRQMNSNKRFDDIVEYEDVDDELRDLLHRLLHKNPTKRISIKEVKHHPWVLRGIQNQPAWIDETDPDLQSEGRKIEISNQDVQGAVIPLIGKMVKGMKRMSSVLRGRNRKRAESDIKEPGSTASARSSKEASSALPQGRRASLRGDEQIFTALRASRENSEHPLTQSVTASPELRNEDDYFDEASTLMMGNARASPSSKRPSLPDRSVSTKSTSESTRTIRATVPSVIKERSSPPSENLSTTTTIIGASSPSSLSAIYAGTSRKWKSHERSRNRDTPSAASSRSSSVSAEVLAPHLEDLHGSPSLAFSTAVAAGHVNTPLALQDDTITYEPLPSSRPLLRHDSSSEAFQKAKDLNDRRRAKEFSEASEAPNRRQRATFSADNVPCPPSPDDESFPASHIGISSSSEHFASTISESFSHPSIPSVVSGASSVSGTIEPDERPLEKSASPSTIVPRQEDILADRLDEDPAQLTPREDDFKTAADEDEAGYNGEEEMDSDSDDGVLEMGGQPKPPEPPNPPMTTI